ncbi:MAG: hypothetical protein VXB01_03485 [Opitutae bacterium]
MTDFEKHIGHELPEAVLAHLNNTPTLNLRNQAEKLKFDSWCPVVLENDSPELREDLKKASDLIFQYLKFKSNE